MTLLVIIVWVLPSVLIGMGLGYWLGRSQVREPQPLAAVEKQRVLESLLAVVESTERLSNQVGSHNSELAQVGREVEEIKLGGEWEEVQQRIVGRISQVVESNQRLENELVGVRFQLQAQAQELDRTRKEARTDALSGAANRLAFDEILEYHIARFQNQQEAFAVVLLDIDHFKWINDTHGHPAGDFVVQQVATTLRSLVRETDRVARFGGDEFAILLAKMDPAAAANVAERIRQALSSQNMRLPGGEEAAVTCSMGLAVSCQGDAPKDILARADEALYRSKRGGRNQLHVNDSQEISAVTPALLAAQSAENEQDDSSPPSALAPETILPATSLSSPPESLDPLAVTSPLPSDFPTAQGLVPDTAPCAF